MEQRKNRGRVRTEGQNVVKIMICSLKMPMVVFWLIVEKIFMYCLKSLRDNKNPKVCHPAFFLIPTYKFILAHDSSACNLAIEAQYNH